jgi:hypothetical protein
LHRERHVVEEPLRLAQEVLPALGSPQLEPVHHPHDDRFARQLCGRAQRGGQQDAALDG